MFKKRYITEDLSETITAGDCLRRRREEQGYALEEVSRRLGIKRSYLESLESGDYKELPPGVYVRGFIRRYADLLGVDGGQLIKIYNRELAYLSEDARIASTPEKKGRFDLGDYLVITPRLVTAALSLVVLLGMGYYFLHQINSFNSKPYLLVASPATDAVVKERDLVVRGKTESDAVLSINGQTVSVNGAGEFSQLIALSEGRNVLVIEARNRFDKTETKALNVVYAKPAGMEAAASAPALGQAADASEPQEDASAPAQKPATPVAATPVQPDARAAAGAQDVAARETETGLPAPGASVIN